MCHGDYMYSPLTWGSKNQELNKALNLTYQMHALLINRGEVSMLLHTAGASKT